MRPQDIVLLLKLLTNTNEDWQYRDLSTSLYLSISEISASLNRSHLAGLIDESRRRVYKKSLMEFLEHGIHYVFPQQPGTMVTGVPTAHSHPYFSSKITSEINYAWPDESGWIRGLSITPLYKNLPKAIRHDEELYLALAAVDIIRVGRTRELKMALDVLKSRII